MRIEERKEGAVRVVPKYLMKVMQSVEYLRRLMLEWNRSFHKFYNVNYEEWVRESRACEKRVTINELSASVFKETRNRIATFRSNSKLTRDDFIQLDASLVCDEN